MVVEASAGKGGTLPAELPQQLHELVVVVEDALHASALGDTLEHFVDEFDGLLGRQHFRGEAFHEGRIVGKGAAADAVAVAAGFLLEPLHELAVGGTQPLGVLQLPSVVFSGLQRFVLEVA